MAEFGTESCFNTVNTEYNAVAMLDSTHVVVAFKDSGGAGYGCAKIGLIDGNTVTWGAEKVFNSGGTRHISVSALDSSHFVVSYRDDGNSGYGTAIVGLVSGTTISSYGAENAFNEAITNYTSVSTFDSTHFVVGYRDEGNSFYGTARIGLVSGTTISSYGAENVFNTGVTAYISVAILDSTHFVVGYRDEGGDNYGQAKIGVVSGTTISSYGAENTFNGANTYYISVAALDATHFVVTYQDVVQSNYGTARIGLVSGTTISSYGAETVFSSGSSHYMAVSAIDSTHFVVVYAYTASSGYGTSVIGTVSGTTISCGSSIVFNAANTNYLAVITLNSTDYVVVYKDDGGADYGCGRVWFTAPQVYAVQLVNGGLVS